MVLCMLCMALPNKVKIITNSTSTTCIVYHKLFYSFPHVSLWNGVVNKPSSKILGIGRCGFALKFWLLNQKMDSVQLPLSTYSIVCSKDWIYLEKVLYIWLLFFSYF